MLQPRRKNKIPHRWGAQGPLEERQSSKWSTKTGLTATSQTTKKSQKREGLTEFGRTWFSVLAKTKTNLKQFVPGPEFARTSENRAYMGL